MQTKKYSFAQFLQAFPTIELPVTLNEEAHHTFSQVNKPLPSALIEQFLAETLGPVDESTEFIPCFRYTEKDKFHAIVVCDLIAKNGDSFAAAVVGPGTLNVELRRITEQVVPGGVVGLCGAEPPQYVWFAYDARATTVTMLVFSGWSHRGPRR